MQWGLRILGLVGVAVISGVVWYYVIDDGKQENTAGDQGGTEQKAEGRYAFTPHPDMTSPATDENCAEHAYGRIREHLQSTPCDHLSQQLFVTEVDGRTVYASVSVVTMPDDEKAAELRALTDEDGSGNVNDVVRDRGVTIEGMDRLSAGGGYAAKQNGNEVVIVEADLDPKDQSETEGDQKKDEKNILDPVCEDALLLAQQVDTKSG
ncbi:hypothetical protein [Actinophytocola algeriensis]|uniref:Uncharacterized protein n=1 Tax=Actinophytocola algeriensis TaxID=1768010 RepID=A0A7W7QBD6_9PSEU|nr:hypothetical protein [Actinophytocola algeriensis]MBB4910450.1 hypothetical protein [Actinophytocola algeriensis]MBE1480561.1 hypothetical protein [Actinophytocola algeriensis]